MTEGGLFELFASAACACRPNTLEWCKVTQFVVFASQRTICIVSDVMPFRIIETVERAHSSGEITSLTFLRGTFGNCQNEVSSLFCSASSSGELALWKLRKTPPTTVEDGHRHALLIKRTSKNVSIALSKMAAYSDSDCELMLASLLFDNIDVQFLDLNCDKIGADVVSLNFRNAIPTTFELSQICGAVVMAVGLSTGLVDIFISEANSHLVQKKMSLDLCANNKSWSRALAFGNQSGLGCLSLAAASDGLIKIWQFDGISEKTLASPSVDDDKLKICQQSFCVKGNSVTVTLESVLHGQTESIYALAWHPNGLELLSSGANRTVVRWAYSVSDAIWLPLSRFGDVAAEEVNCYDVTYSPCGHFALCHSFLGGFHFWEIDSKGVFPKCFPISGHFAQVTDLCWEPNGAFLLTCSSDMTTRIFSKHAKKDFFFEIARPQTHGHPINCVASVNRNLFVSGGEEKIFRVFQATSSFAQNLATLSQHSGSASNGQCFSQLPSAAAFQTELTLTNKAVTEFEGDGHRLEEDGGRGDVCATADSLLFDEPPREDQLSKLTLFPEEHKLYGHGFEVFSCASSRNGKVLATCCKASHFEHAAILLWDTSTWKLMNTLGAHQLTVTRMAFSFDDQFLLSVSRDRTWTLFRRPNDSLSSSFDYKLFSRTANGKGHSRIIWDCAWSPDAHLFATCSRDKALKLWSICNGEEQQELSEVKCLTTYVGPESLTATDFAPRKIQERVYLLAVGFENGSASLFTFDPVSNVLQMFLEFSTNFHSGMISRLRFCPLIGKEEEKSDQQFLIASASCCNIVKIHAIKA